MKCLVYVCPKHQVCTVTLGTGGASGVWGHLALGFRFPRGGSFRRVTLRAYLHLRECGVSALVSSGGVSDSFNPHGNALR